MKFNSVQPTAKFTRRCSRFSPGQKTLFDQKQPDVTRYGIEDISTNQNAWTWHGHTLTCTTPL